MMLLENNSYLRLVWESLSPYAAGGRFHFPRQAGDPTWSIKTQDIAVSFKIHSVAPSSVSAMVHPQGDVFSVTQGEVSY